MRDEFKTHEAARIRIGNYAGLVGMVTEVRAKDGKQTGVRVRIEGVHNGQEVNVERWFRRSEVERNHGA